MDISAMAEQISENRKITRTRRQVRRIAVGIIKFIFLFGFCFVILYPVLVMLLRTFMSMEDLVDNTVIYIPRHFTMQNIGAAIMTLNYWESLFNTVAVTLSTTALQVISCMLVGYGFARHNFKGKNLLFGLVILTLIIPPILLTTPYFTTFRQFTLFGLIPLFNGGEPVNLLSTYLPFLMLGGTCMGVKNGIFIYLFRQHFRNMPMELEEAGIIDGAGSLGVFFKIMVPNAVTMIVTVTLFSIVWQYNDVTFTRVLAQPSQMPMFATMQSELNTISDALRIFLGYDVNDLRVDVYYPLLKNAGGCMMVFPLMIFYFILQKFFIQGVERSGIVG